MNNDINGKGKEYKDSKLIFKGEYKNGKRNGKGKEYYYHNGKLLFEGDFLNNILQILICIIKDYILL